MDRRWIPQKVCVSLIALSLSSSRFQARFQIETAHPCCWYCENWQLGDCSHFKKWEFCGSYLHHGWVLTRFLFSFNGSNIFLLEDNNENTTADQTLSIRRIALRSDIPLKRKASWAPTLAPRTFFQHLHEMLVPEDDSWISMMMPGWILFKSPIVLTMEIYYTYKITWI